MTVERAMAIVRAQHDRLVWSTFEWSEIDTDQVERYRPDERKALWRDVGQLALEPAGLLDLSRRTCCRRCVLKPTGSYHCGRVTLTLNFLPINSSWVFIPTHHPTGGGLVGTKNGPLNSAYMPAAFPKEPVA